ncbi:phosphoribosylanthranilate isomerase [Verrucomicrobiota bacterium sgz303538]
MSALQNDRVRVKICGITNQRDAEEAIACGADALGFNTWPGTKRFIDLEREASWIRQLPPFVSRVALVVNATLDEAQRIAALPFVDALQFHGDEDAAYCAKFAATGKMFIKALRIRKEEDLQGIDAFSTKHVLIDAHVAGLFGGTGVRVDLSLATLLRERFPSLTLVLAGGLRPDNVSEAVRTVRPFAVDVSSGVESEPGKKDAGLLRAFISAVRNSA